jgi:hypothetical protein
VAIPFDKWKKVILKGSLRHWLQFPNSFIAPLQTSANRKLTAADIAVCAVGNYDPNCKQLYKVALNLSRALTGWGTGGFFLKPPRLTLLWRPVEWNYFRPDPSRWTVPLKSFTLKWDFQYRGHNGRFNSKKYFINHLLSIIL